MDIILNSFLENKFHLCLLSNIDNIPNLTEIEKNDKIVVLNPNYVRYIFK